MFDFNIASKDGPQQLPPPPDRGATHDRGERPRRRARGRDNAAGGDRGDRGVRGHDNGAGHERGSAEAPARIIQLVQRSSDSLKQYWDAYCDENAPRAEDGMTF